MHYAVVEINSGRLVYCGTSDAACGWQLLPGRFHAEAESELEAQDAAAQKCVRYRTRNGAWKPLPEVTVRRFNPSILTTE